MLGASTPISPGQGNTLGGRALPSSRFPCPTGMHAAHFSGSRKGLGYSCPAENQTPPTPHILLSWGCPNKPAQAGGLKQKLMLSRLWRPGVQNESASRAVSFQSPAWGTYPGLSWGLPAVPGVPACRHITPVSALPLAFCVSVIPFYKDICHWLWATLSPE